jgi:hypothetical protein
MVTIFLTIYFVKFSLSINHKKQTLTQEKTSKEMRHDIEKSYAQATKIATENPEEAIQRFQEIIDGGGHILI